jgi:tripartite-type tricarboxylate transporter receptor subunit TctC
MKKLLSVILSAAAIAAASPAVAQTYPDKPIRMVVPYAPGGATDIVARLLAAKMTTVLGQQVLVENKPGASANMGAESVVRAAPDGYTLLLGDLTLVVNPGLFKTMSFDPIRDLAPIGPVAVAPLALVVHSSVPAQNLRELIELARRSPGNLTYGSGGNGNPTHLAVEVLKKAAGVDIMHVPYKGAGPAISDLAGGRTTMMIAGVSSVRQLVQGGRLRALAVTGNQRAEALPSVPTFREAGLPLPEMSLGSWWGLFAPAKLPKDIEARLSAALNTALSSPDFKERTSAMDIDAEPGSAETLRQRMNTETAKWKQFIQSANIVAD